MKIKIFLPVIIALSTMGCGLFAISASDKRDAVPKSIALPEGITLTAIGAVKIGATDFFTSGFKIEATGKTIYIDPVMAGQNDYADFIFITHAHPDHFSIGDIATLAGEKTVIVCPHAVTGELSSNYNVTEIKPGDILKLDGFTCEVYPAYNLKPVLLWLYPHAKEDMNAGYVLDFGGTRIYHAGDTDFIPELKMLSNITAALVPIGGDGLTMNIVDAASLINSIRPEIVVPMHYEIGKTNAQKFAASIDPGIRVEIMQGND